MILFAKQAALICLNDLRNEMREFHHFVSVVLFGLLLLLLFSFALSVDPEIMRKMAPGLFWLATLFSSLLILDRSFRKETEDGQWEGLLLLGVDPKALYLGKLMANLVLTWTLQLCLLPVMVVLFDIGFDIGLTPSLGLILFLGSLGISILGTFYSGLTAAFREGQFLLPLLLFPMLVPVLLCAVKVTELNLAHDLFGQQVAWLKLLSVFDLVFLMGALLCADSVLDKAD